MWGAIIQAIDHAMGRMHEGAGAGIKVANSQGSGGGAPISNPDSGSGNTAKVAQNLENQNTGNSEQAEAAEEAKIGSNSTATGEVPDGGGQDEGGAGSLGDIGGIGGGEGAADAASSIVSDANAKSAQNVGSNNNEQDKDEQDNGEQDNGNSGGNGTRAYLANVGKGFANAGAIATGNKAAADWKDIDTSVAKKAAENTVKNWRNRNFNSNANNQTGTTEGK